MSSTLCKHRTTGDISVNLSVTLSTLKVDALLLSDLLEARALPFWQPALWVGLRSGVLGIEALGVADVSLSLACRHENLCTTLSLLDDVFALLFLSSLWHTVIDQFCDNVNILIISLKLRERELLL